MHYNFSETNSMHYLVPHHISSVQINRAITPAQIKCNKLERWANKINYNTAFRVKSACLLKLEGPEQDDFAKMNALRTRIKSLDPFDSDSAIIIKTEVETNHFESMFVAPHAT
jgi:hypothetical protein